jgi:hypothetical protein
MEGRRDWLDQFPAAHRGAIANWFYEVARLSGGTVDPAKGCSMIYRDQARQLQRYGSGSGVDKASVLRAMEKDPEGAKALMVWVIEREARSPEQRQKDKADAEQQGKRAYMEALPPTQKQLDVLMRLGVDVFPDNRWHASELIEANKDW